MVKIDLIRRLFSVISILILSLKVSAQISPGDLTKVHAHLEGISNCTKCHTLGAKVSNEKCLDCHKEIQARLNESKGFHSSLKIKGKECTTCHSDHYGRNYDIVHLQIEKFDHNDTGYKLEGKHQGKDCRDCHKTEHIADVQIKKKQETYLGLNDRCLTCHEDFHQKTLPVNCQNCHNTEAFKPALKFDHSKSRYPLKGKHAEVQCEKCHIKSVREGKNFQQFAGLQFQSCANCHKDPHENKFGQICTQCHTEDSFKSLKSQGNFDHSKTGFLLDGRHAQVACKLCHKVNMTAPVKHDQCMNCHKDYHHNQFLQNDKLQDCAECHDVTGFAGSSFSVSRHNLSKFKLEGAHLATPCFECHKKGADWSFRGIGEKCVECHKDVHMGLLDVKYYPAQNCESCHRVTAWSEIKFEHQQTSFILEGKHAATSCRKCHFEFKAGGKDGQRFNSLDQRCVQCHADIHFGQFDTGTEITCIKCHGFENWKPDKFDHNATRFKLDGGHKTVACYKCHKVITKASNTFINYHYNEILCATCHLH